MPQIHIRPAIAEDIPVLMQIPHHSQAPIVWQMEKFEEEGEETVIFRQVRLPRPARLDYPRPSTYLEKGWTEFTTMAVAQLNGDLVGYIAVSYTHLRAHETPEHLVCRLLLEKKKKTQRHRQSNINNTTQQTT